MTHIEMSDLGSFSGEKLSASSTYYPFIIILPLKIKYGRATYEIPDLDADFSSEGKAQFITAMNSIDPATEPGRILNGREPGLKSTNPYLFHRT